VNGRDCAALRRAQLSDNNVGLEAGEHLKWRESDLQLHGSVELSGDDRCCAWPMYGQDSPNSSSLEQGVGSTKTVP
jgi:hypothetical protein